MPRTAVVIGGAGFIGSHLVRSLDEDGWETFVVDVAPGRTASERLLRGDVRSTLDPTHLPARPDLLVNLAAIHKEPGHEPAEYFDANVTGALRVIELCERLEAAHVVFTSSISVYGTTEQTVDERQPLNPAGPYGESKAQAEEHFRAWANADTGRRLTVVRPAAIFGPGEGGNFTRLATALARRRFVFPGRRDTIKGCGYVPDLVRSMLYMHGRDPVTIYNHAFPRPYTLEEIVAALSDVGDLPRARLTVPLFAMRAAGRIGDVIPPLGRSTGLSLRRIEKLVTSTDVRPTVLMDAGFEFDFDLPGAFEHWLAQDPVGTFV